MSYANGSAEEPYTYTGLTFNKGMNAAAGPLMVGDGASDVVNALWDATGFMYPRNAFHRFNNTKLSPRPILGISRYLRRAEVPFSTASSHFLAADSTWIFQDSSITDAAAGFKKEPIFTNRGTVSTTQNSRVVTGVNTRFIKSVVPRDPFFTPLIVDSATSFRVGGRNRRFVKVAITDDTLTVMDAFGVDTTSTNATNHKLYPVFDTLALKSFAVIGNKVYFSDSTRPVWGWDGSTPEVAFVVDSGRVNSTTLGSAASLNDGTAAWFDNEWTSYWVRFPNRIMRDRGAVGGTDSVMLSPWVPIVGNTDTTLYLKFHPTYGNVGSNYYIMALPVERLGTEKSVTFMLADSMLVSTDLATLNERLDILAAWPLSVLITKGPGMGELRVISGWYWDTLYFFHDKFKTPPTNASKFVLVCNVPPFPKTITVHQNRLWYVGDVSAANRIYYSEPLQPGRVGPFNYLDVSPRNGDALITASSYQGQLLAYQTNSVFRIVGDNPSNFVVLPFLENLGTPGINTRTAFGGEEYFYDYRTGIYALREFNPVRLSDPVKPFLDSIPSAAAKNASLAFFKDHLWFSYPAGANQTRNNRLLTLNVRVPDTWARHSFAKASTMSVWPLAGDTARLTFGDPDSGTVYFYNDTAHVDAGQSALIKTAYKTGWMPFSVPEFRKQWRGFQLAFAADSITGVAGDKDSVYLYKDFSTTAFDTLIFTREGQLDNYVAKDIYRDGLGRLFQLEMRMAPRTGFKLYWARSKWASVGERQ